MRTLQEVQEQHQRKESEFQVRHFWSNNHVVDDSFQGQSKDTAVHAKEIRLMYSDGFLTSKYNSHAILILLQYWYHDMQSNWFSRHA